jgi:carboxypeptidase Taq
MKHFQAFLKYEAKLNHLRSLEELLAWDQQVCMPSKALHNRTQINTTLAKEIHEQASHQKRHDLIGEAKEELRQKKPDDKISTAQILEAEKDYLNVSSLPQSLVEKRSLAEGKGYETWIEACEKKEFKVFKGALGELIELKKEQAHYKKEALYAYIKSDDLYDYLLCDFDPDIKAKQCDEYFSDLKTFLIPIVERSAQEPSPAFHLIKGKHLYYSEDKQEAFAKEVVQKIGFDFSKGRVDRARHPFCIGLPNDVRITTRYREHDFTDSFFSLIHEAGHGLYEQQLPAEWEGTPLGVARSMSLHESQSRLWENSVARSFSFWKGFYPKMKTMFPNVFSTISLEDFVKLLNAVEIQPIRTDADELTYNLHIILRYELERALLSGDLKVDDLPAAWDEKSEKMLFLKPKNIREGVLQDIHWSDGAFGYFPTYAIGNLIAAQLMEKAHQEMNLNENFEKGDFEPLRKWLREKVHSKGSSMSTDEILKNSTGKSLSTGPLKNHLVSLTN